MSNIRSVYFRKPIDGKMLLDIVHRYNQTRFAGMLQVEGNETYVTLILKDERKDKEGDYVVRLSFWIEGKKLQYKTCLDFLGEWIISSVASHAIRTIDMKARIRDEGYPGHTMIPDFDERFPNPKSYFKVVDRFGSIFPVYKKWLPEFWKVAMSERD